jgi:hypothetical protein
MKWRARPQKVQILIKNGIKKDIGNSNVLKKYNLL